MVLWYVKSIRAAGNSISIPNSNVATWKGYRKSNPTPVSHLLNCYMKPIRSGTLAWGIMRSQATRFTQKNLLKPTLICKLSCLNIQLKLNPKA